jgi:hypothetical protein
VGAAQRYREALAIRLSTAGATDASVADLKRALDRLKR